MIKRELRTFKIDMDAKESNIVSECLDLINTPHVDSREDLLQEIGELFSDGLPTVGNYETGDDYTDQEVSDVMMQLNNMIDECPEGCDIKFLMEL